MRTLFFVALVFLAACKKENDKPMPACQVDCRTSCYLSEPLTFRFTGSNAEQIAWQFSDGTTATGQAVDHWFMQSGLQWVRCTASNSQGSDTKTVNIAVNTGNASFTVKNLSGITSEFLTYYYNGEILDLVNHGTFYPGAQTNETQTSRPQVWASSVIDSEVYLFVYPWPVTQFKLNQYAIYDTSSVFHKKTGKHYTIKDLK